MRLLFQWNNHGISFVDLQFCSVSRSGNNEEKRCPIKEDPLLLILKFLSTTLLVIGILFSPIIKNSIARSILYSINRICDTDLNFSFRVWKKRYFGELEISQEGYIFWKIRYFLSRNNFDRRNRSCRKTKGNSRRSLLKRPSGFWRSPKRTNFSFFSVTNGLPWGFSAHESRENRADGSVGRK